MVVDGAESGDDFGGGLEATEEGRDEYSVDRKLLIPKLLTRTEGPYLAGVDEGRVPLSGGGDSPERLEVVNPVAVPHDDDILVETRGLIGGLHCC